MRLPRQRTTTAEDPRDRVWTIDAVRQLGMTTDIETAANIFGIGRTLAYDLLRTGQFPVTPLRLGRRVLIPVPGILAALGASTLIQPSTAAPVERDRS